MRRSKKGKRKKRKRQNRGLSIIKKSIIKTLAILLIVGLNWTGLLAVGRTFGYFNDIENSPENIYQAGTLDFSAKGLGDFSLNLNPNNQAVRNVMVGNEGSLEFKHLVEASDLEGDLCDYLNIMAMFEGDEKYDGSLVGLSSEIVEVAGFTPNKNWNFKISFSGDKNDTSSLDGKACQFNFYFKAWQTNMDKYNEGSGFTDQEKVFTRVSLRVPHALAQDYVVLNEFLPNPLGGDCELQGLAGEWIELYNNHSDQSFDLSGWYIEDEANHQILITDDNTYNNSSVIGAKGSDNEWLVVFIDGCILNNDGGDTVSLYHNSGSLVDSYSYIGPAPENKSYARYPDGTGPWYDPVPTPGGPNRLEPFGISDLFAINETSGQEEIPEPILETATPSTEEVIVIEEEPQIENQESDETLINEPEELEDVPQSEPLKEPEPEPEPEPEQTELQVEPELELEPEQSIEEEILIKEPAIEEETVIVPENDPSPAEPPAGAPADVISE